MRIDHTVPDITAEEQAAALAWVDTLLRNETDTPLWMAFPHAPVSGPQTHHNFPDRVALARRLLRSVRRLIDPADAGVVTPAQAAADMTAPAAMSHQDVKRVLVHMPRTELVDVAAPGESTAEPEVVTVAVGNNGDDVLRAVLRSVLIVPLAELARRVTEQVVNERRNTDDD